MFLNKPYKSRYINPKVLYWSVFFVIFLSLFTTNTKIVKAERLDSDSYVIQFGNFNITAGEKDSTSYHLTDTAGQIAVGPYGQWGSSSYFVGSGFQYIYQIRQFRFTISDLDIDLGVLTPGIHNTASNQLRITTRGAEGYSVYAFELHPLRHQSGSVNILDTTCDASDCDETSATVWSDEDIPGFGFNATGDTVASDFINSTYFRQFADRSLSENMQIIMSSNTISINDTAEITYKASVPGSIAAGKYQTGIVYVAVPGF